MDFELKSELPFISITLVYRATQFEVNETLIDTGSATTPFASDYLSKFGIVPQSGDKVCKIIGVGEVSMSLKNELTLSLLVTLLLKRSV